MDRRDLVDRHKSASRVDRSFSIRIRPSCNLTGMLFFIHDVYSLSRFVRRAANNQNPSRAKTPLLTPPARLNLA